MKLKRRLSTPIKNTVLSGVIMGIVCSLIISVLFIAGFSGIVISGKSIGNVSDVTIFTIRAISILAGVLVGTGFAKEKWLIISASIVSGYLLFQICSCTLVFDCKFSDVLPNVLSVTVGGLLGYIIRLKTQNHSKKVRKKRY